MENIIYIVDDHNMVRTGLKYWLESHTRYKVPKDFSSSSECLECLRNFSQEQNNLPEIIIVDVQLMNDSGFTLVKEIKKNYPEIKSVMYSMFDTTGFILQAQDSGAKGYISKVAKEEELVHCLDIVQAGGTYIGENLQKSQNKVSSIVTILTKQERNIFEAILQEKTNAQICEEYFLSQRTVENYTSRLYSKIGVKSREDLIARYK